MRFKKTVAAAAATCVMMASAASFIKSVTAFSSEIPAGPVDVSVELNGVTDEYAKKGACHLPMVILVDGGTASASEVMAGCMQARDRAVIIGEKTYGKGVSQLVCSIGNNNADGILKVTTYKNYRPDGIWLNEGVTPDIEAASAPAYDEYGDIVFDAEGEDIPLKLALEELRKKF